MPVVFDLSVIAHDLSHRHHIQMLADYGTMIVVSDGRVLGRQMQPDVSYAPDIIFDSHPA